MKAHNIRPLLTALAALGFASAATAQGPSPAPSPASSPALSEEERTERATIAAIKAAGLRGDRSQVQVLIAALKNPKYDTVAMQALAQLGSPEAIAALDERARQKGSLSPYEKAVRARLVAKRAATGIPSDVARSKVFLIRFLQEVGLDVPQLNTARQKERERRGSPHAGSGIAVQALLELADEIYHHRDAALAAQAQAAGIDFEQYAPAALKVRLALLSPQERVEQLIEELAQKKAITPLDFFTIQLAANEGVLASRAAAAKLLEMKADRDKYPPTGFAALFRLINGVGDKEQAPVVAQFLKDSDNRVAYDAVITYPEISNGIAKQYVLGY